MDVPDASGRGAKNPAKRVASHGGKHHRGVRNPEIEARHHRRYARMRRQGKFLLGNIWHQIILAKERYEGRVRDFNE
jgi:hypothetical protein